MVRIENWQLDLIIRWLLFLVHWFDDFGSERIWVVGLRWWVVGFHLFSGWARPWVAAHFEMEQWAQSKMEKRNEF